MFGSNAASFMSAVHFVLSVYSDWIKGAVLFPTTFHFLFNLARGHLRVDIFHFDGRVIICRVDRVVATWWRIFHKIGRTQHVVRDIIVRCIIVVSVAISKAKKTFDATLGFNLVVTR